jgi:EAL domain-containing protein (putative c-di-GMP-specific phosphodiesterase class I)
MRLIDKVGTWLIREACCTANCWPDNLNVAVNLSPVQFASEDICAVVADALRQSGIKPHRLELEITESVLLGDSETNLSTLTKLKGLGVSIVIDNFGKSDSALGCLWKFPFDKIKIDRGLIDCFGKSGHHVETVLRSLVALGREMKMRVTVEGIETSDQVDFLRDANVDQVQGFYFGMPAPASEVSRNLPGNTVGRFDQMTDKRATSNHVINVATA